MSSRFHRKVSNQSRSSTPNEFPVQSNGQIQNISIDFSCLAVGQSCSREMSVLGVRFGHWILWRLRFHNCRQVNGLCTAKKSCYMCCAGGRCGLVLLEAALKVCELLGTIWPDLLDHWVWGCALSNLHLQVLTLVLPCWWVGGHTWPILFHLFLAEPGRDFHSCLHVLYSYFQRLYDMKVTAKTCEGS